MRRQAALRPSLIGVHMKKRSVEKANGRLDPGAKIAEAILDFVGNIPDSEERKRGKPEERAREIASKAAGQAALTSGSLAVPVGPLGWLTLLPDLIAVWKIQAKMVADIAAVYGKTEFLTREQMLYCLFRHVAAQAFRDVVVRMGERVLTRRASLRLLRSIASRVGIRVTQRTVGKGLARFLPIVGALGVAAYAYYDTGQVANTAMELFAGEIEVGQERDADTSSPLHAYRTNALQTSRWIISSP